MDPPLHPARLRAIRRRLVGHYDRRRRDLPWRREKDPYRIWVSEVMLQQTRVETAIPYYRRWLERFPTLEALADADGEDVLAAWSGLGYYHRARNLHRAACVVRDRHGGDLPTEAAALRELPGIGPYTAGAVASIAFGRREAAIDGNARRVLARLFDLARPTRVELAGLAAALVPSDRPGDFNQALMDIGATICRPRRPSCGACPLSALCLARRRGTVHERPEPRPGRTVPELQVGTAILISPEGRVLLARRPEDGLLGGMWEFPGAITGPRESPIEAALRAARKLVPRAALDGPSPDRRLTRVPHLFSHRRHVYHAFGFRARAENEIRTPPRIETGGLPDDGMAVWTTMDWIHPGSMGGRAVPAAQRTIGRALSRALALDE